LGSAVVLLIVALLQTIRLLSVRAAGALLPCIGALLLLVELAFFIQVNAIQTDLEASFRDNPRIHLPTVYNVLWAFWLSVVVSAAALVVGMYTLLRRKQPAPGMISSRPASLRIPDKTIMQTGVGRTAGFPTGAGLC
jgi:hypothetical protein